MSSSSPNLRVLTVTNMYPTADRPAHGTFVAEEVTALRGRGVEVDVLFIDGPRSKLNYARGVGWIRSKLASYAERKPRYDLIHAHYVFCGMMALAATASLTGAARHTPVVLTQHGIETQLGWTAPLCRWTSKRVARTIATSPRVAAALTQGAVEPDALGRFRVTVLPCGVDTDLFRPMPQAAARGALGLTDDGPIILFVGAPRPEKRLPLIKEAVAELRKNVPAARLLVAHDEPRERIPLFMNAADTLVLASVAEGSPMVVREALACGLPVVSTDVGDVVELLQGLPGCYIADPDAADLARKIRLSLETGAQPEGRLRVLPWSVEQVAARVEGIYRVTLGRETSGVLRSETSLL